MFRFLAIFIAFLLLMCLTGCHPAEKVSFDDVPEIDAPVRLLGTAPEYLVELQPDTTLTLYFDAVPKNFWASTQEAVVRGKTVVVTLRKGDFKGEFPDLRIKWDPNGSDLWRLIGDADWKVVWTANSLPSKRTKWFAAIDTADGATESQGPVRFLRADPPEGQLVSGADIIRLYFDKRPRHVTLMNGSFCIQQAIVKGNTVEVSLDFPPGWPFKSFGFTLRWTDANRSFTYKCEPLR